MEGAGALNTYAVEPGRRALPTITHDVRAVLSGLLWVLGPGAAWTDLPARFPPGATGVQRFSRWVNARGMRGRLETLAVRAMRRTIRQEILDSAVGWKRTSAYATDVRMSYHLSNTHQRSGGRAH